MDINEIIRQVTEEICSKYGAQTQTPAASDGYTPADMAKYIDHTYLKPEARLVPNGKAMTQHGVTPLPSSCWATY